ARENWYEDYDRMKEYSIYNTVAGQVAAGNIVDVIVNYDDGTYDVVLAKKKIKNIRYQGSVAHDGTLTLESGTTAAATVVFDVDEVEYSDLEASRQKGRFEVRIYLDEDQPASAVTFQNPNRKTNPDTVKPTIVGDGTGKQDD